MEIAHFILFFRKKNLQTVVPVPVLVPLVSPLLVDQRIYYTLRWEEGELMQGSSNRIKTLQYETLWRHKVVVIRILALHGFRLRELSLRRS